MPIAAPDNGVDRRRFHKCSIGEPAGFSQEACMRNSRPNTGEALPWGHSRISHALCAGLSQFISGREAYPCSCFGLRLTVDRTTRSGSSARMYRLLPLSLCPAATRGPEARQATAAQVLGEDNDPLSLSLAVKLVIAGLGYPWQRHRWPIIPLGLGLPASLPCR